MEMNQNDYLDENQDLNSDNNEPNENIEENPDELAQNENNEQDENISESNENDQLNQEKEKYIRLYADFENFKRRTQKEKLEFLQLANQDLIQSLLPVLDDLERASKELAKEGDSEALKGVELIQNKLFATLKDKGLSKIDVKPGDDFDVELEEAITQIPAPTPELEDKIVDVIETGYELNGKVIRFAKVIIGK